MTGHTHTLVGGMQFSNGHMLQYPSTVLSLLMFIGLGWEVCACQTSTICRYTMIK